MLYSQSCEYAIRALSYLALQPEEKFSPVWEIAEHQKIPKHFLGKLLQMLSKNGLVKSFRGPGGGWALNLKAAQISLLKVVKCIDGLCYLERCIFGIGTCSCEDPCPMHEKWRPIKEQIMWLLQTETLAELAAPITIAQEERESVK
ncbi:TPA: Rrf2 family transcriptional regulator [Candidatus Poribacteria bacterium]|nr:Rrf2 family transcriptional regulator [Candidatus Poribacteria bacterium]